MTEKKTEPKVEDGAPLFSGLDDFGDFVKGKTKEAMDEWFEANLPEDKGGEKIVEETPGSENGGGEKKGSGFFDVLFGAR